MANIVAPFSAPGQKPVSQEDSAGRDTPIKPIEQIAAGEKQQLNSRRTQQDTYFPSDPEHRDDALGYGPQSTSDKPEANPLEQREGAIEARKLEQEQRVIGLLSARDREVRAHEQAHAAIGGQYAGAAQFQYERGPDGVRYAVGGEVPIDVGREASPEATIRKAQVVKRAALAPAEPSPQDRRVAAEATRMETTARQDLALARAQQNANASDGVSTEPEPVADTKVTSEANDIRADRPDNRSGVRPEPELGRPADTILSSRLVQGIANASLNSDATGSILDQIV